VLKIRGKKSPIHPRGRKRDDIQTTESQKSGDMKKGSRGFSRRKALKKKEKEKPDTP